MNDPAADSKHFTKAIVQLSEQQDVVATQAIFNSRGQKIVDKGAAINQGLYERLMQHKLSAPIEESVASAASVTATMVARVADELMRDIPFFGRMAADDKARKTMLAVLGSVPLADAIAFQLTVARDVRPEVYLHLVRTALTATWLARTPLVSRFDPAMAAAAGLLHDIGMLHVDPLLLQPEQMLDREQRRQLYSHPLLSVALLERHHQYSREVLRAVGEHHEFMDGSGYPRNLGADAISTLGKILSLAQVVAAMFASGRSAPEMRLSVLLRMNTHRYDNTMAMQVVALLRPRQDENNVAVEALNQPVDRLHEIDELLRQWPLDLGRGGAPGASRREALALLASHAAQIRRSLAGVGVMPDQLAQLGDEVHDVNVQTELSLVTHEATWQLRTLARQTRRRWKAHRDEALPAVLQQWLDDVDALVAKVWPARAGQSVAAPNAGVQA